MFEKWNFALVRAINVQHLTVLTIYFYFVQQKKMTPGQILSLLHPIVTPLNHREEAIEKPMLQLSSFMIPS